MTIRIALQPSGCEVNPLVALGAFKSVHSAVLPEARQTYTFDGMQRKTRSKRERERERDG